MLTEHQFSQREQALNLLVTHGLDRCSPEPSDLAPIETMWRDAGLDWAPQQSWTERYQSTRFGRTLAPVGLASPAERTHFDAEVRRCGSAQRAARRWLLPGLRHELCHGPWRPPHDDHLPRMLLEAAAAWIHSRVWSHDVIAHGWGEAVVGLHGFAQLGICMAAHWGEEAVISVALHGHTPRLTSPESALLRQLGDLLSETPTTPSPWDWQMWRPVVAALGNATPAPLTEMSYLAAAELRALLHDAIPTLPQAPWHPRDLELGLRAALQVVTTHPHGHDTGPVAREEATLVLDLTRATVALDAVSDDSHRSMLGRLPPDLCRHLRQRGAKTVIMHRLSPLSVTDAVSALVALSSTTHELSATWRIDARPSPAGDGPRAVWFAPGTSPIDANSHTTVMGSCFARELGTFMQHNNLPVSIPIPGPIYDPRSLAWWLQQAEKPDPPLGPVVRHRDMWRPLRLHACETGASEGDANGLYRQAWSDLRNALSQSSHLILTLGTAWSWRLIDGDLPVANCHQLPPGSFDRDLLSPDDIVAHLTPVLSSWTNERPSRTVILTVSPVRHLGLTAQEDQRSKAHLQVAVHRMARELPHVHHVAVDGLFSDELTGSRWRKEDANHPSSTAIRLVMDRFGQAWFSTRVHQWVGQIERLDKLLPDVMRNREEALHRYDAYQAALEHWFARPSRFDVRRPAVPETASKEAPPATPAEPHAPLPIEGMLGGAAWRDHEACVALAASIRGLDPPEHATPTQLACLAGLLQQHIDYLEVPDVVLSAVLFHLRHAKDKDELQAWCEDRGAASRPVDNFGDRC